MEGRRPWKSTPHTRPKSTHDRFPEKTQTRLHKIVLLFNFTPSSTYLTRFGEIWVFTYTVQIAYTPHLIHIQHIHAFKYNGLKVLLFQIYPPLTLSIFAEFSSNLLPIQLINNTKWKTRVTCRCLKSTCCKPHHHTQMFTSVVSLPIQLTIPQVVITVLPLPLYFLRIIRVRDVFPLFHPSSMERSIIIVYDADDTKCDKTRTQWGRDQSSCDDVTMI